MRPDVISVVHCHARPLIPFGTAKGAKLRPMSHMCGFLGCGVPIFEIREAGGMTDMLVRTAPLGKALAETLGDKNVVLMRGHGATMVGKSIQETVFRAVYSMDNAVVQMQAHALAAGGEVEFLIARGIGKVQRRPQRSALLVAMEAPDDGGKLKLASLDVATNAVLEMRRAVPQRSLPLVGEGQGEG